MEEFKPEFLQFVKLQNDPHYLLTGVITDNKTGISYTEQNYARTKCVFDFILLAASLAFVILSFWLIGEILRLWYDRIFLNFLMLTFTMSFNSFLIPLLIKLLRCFSSLRWRYVFFDNDRPQTKSAVYLEYYNRFFWQKRSKKKAIVDNHYQERHIRIPHKWMITVTDLLIDLCLFAGTLALFKGLIVWPVVYGSLVLMYGLSHAAAWYNWKRDCQPEAEQTATIKTDFDEF